MAEHDDDQEQQQEQPGGQDDGQPQQPDRPGRVHFRRGARNPNGSWGSVRTDVLAALGVLKIATYKQLHALVANDPDDREHKRTEHVREAVKDLEKHKLVEERGYTSPLRKADEKKKPADVGANRNKPQPGGPGAEKIWGLTPLGLAAAAEALGDDRDMGGHARGAGKTGAPHAMLVSEIIVTATTGTTTHGAGPREHERDAPPRRTLPCGPLPGGLDDWATEVAHTITGKHNVIPDAVLRAPELGFPVMFLELDRGTMTDVRKVAAKLDNYKRWFDKTTKDGSYERPQFEMDYGSLKPPTYGYHHSDVVRPPVLFVLDQGTKGSKPRFTPEGLMDRLSDLRTATAQHWTGFRHTDEGVQYYTFAGKIPVLGTTTNRLREHGFLGPSWWRFGREEWQTLAQALDDTPNRGLIRQRRKDREQQEKDDRAAEAKAKQDAANAKRHEKLLAARAHNDQMHPCYTCQGPLGGAHGSEGELTKQAEPDRTECPACHEQRRRDGGRPIVLTLPSNRDLKKADKHGPPTDDPWWNVRLIHAQRWPKSDRESGNVPELWPNARA
ncbi:replication-relaxation family protein [Kitasatospora sp. NPDC088264]|uniref:replication-relaxation family protein n=1 Tax=Kitasatospora sp. NPDC088264 TaxID=3155296 RepID=UPI003444E692